MDDWWLWYWWGVVVWTLVLWDVLTVKDFAISLAVGVAWPVTFPAHVLRKLLKGG